MKKAILIPMAVFAVMFLSGCGIKEQTSYSLPLPAKKANQGSTSTVNTLETTAPDTTNDLPTAIDETEKDLQLIENDMREIDQLNMAEENIDF